MPGEYLMNYKELFIALGLLILITAIYIALRKFIVWTIQDDDKWHKKQGHVGLTKGTLKVKRKLAFDKLTGGYLLAMGLVVLYIIKLIADAV